MDRFNFNKLIAFLLVFNLSGCYSYRSISMEDYKQDKEHNSVKLLLKNGEEIAITDKDSVQFITEDDKIILIKKRDERTIGINEIENIKEERFDLLKMCFGISWILFISILIAVWVSPPMKFG